MILCAGYGTRLGELTRETPKVMLLLQRRPLLEYTISYLAQQGFDEIAINLHFMPDAIRDYFGNGNRWGVTITYSYEPKLLGTAGAVKKMGDFLGKSEFFLIYYGDVLTDQDLRAMVCSHRERQALATLLVHRRSQSNSIVHLDEEERIVEFLERPDKEASLRVDSCWVNSGICLCAPDFLDAIPKNTPCDLPRDIFTNLIFTRRLYGFPLSGYRCATDSPERLAEARRAVADGRVEIRLIGPRESEIMDATS